MATDADVSRLTALLHAAYKELGDMGLNYTATYQDDSITRERIGRGRAFLLEDGATLVASVLLTAQNYFTGHNTAYISQLAVRPDYKRHGIGAFLMDHCESLAQDEKFAGVQLDTAQPAQHLVQWYQRRGYRIVGETQWDGKTYKSFVFEKLF